jgi:uncharacterized membrane protein
VASISRFSWSRTRRTCWTAGSRGLLLSVGFFEHRVVVLPDDRVKKKLSAEASSELCDLIA